MKIQITLIHEQDKESKMYFLRMIARIRQMKLFKTLLFIVKTLSIELDVVIFKSIYSFDSYKLAEQIIKAVFKYYYIDLKYVRGKSQKAEYVLARQIAMKIISDLKINKISSTTIGLFFDRDHATVLHAIKTINNRIETDKQFAKQFAEIEKLFK